MRPGRESLWLWVSYSSLLTKGGVLLYCACVSGNFLTAQNELAKANRRREESMLGKPGILTGAARPVPGKATLVVNSIPVPQPRSRPRKLGDPTRLLRVVILMLSPVAR